MDSLVRLFHDVHTRAPLINSAVRKQPEGREQKFLVQVAEFQALLEALDLPLGVDDPRQHLRQFAAGDGPVGAAAGFLRQPLQAAFVEIADHRLALGVEQVTGRRLLPGNRDRRALRRADGDGMHLDAGGLDVAHRVVELGAVVLAVGNQDEDALVVGGRRVDLFFLIQDGEPVGQRTADIGAEPLDAVVMQVVQVVADVVGIFGEIGQDHAAAGEGDEPDAVMLGLALAEGGDHFQCAVEPGGTDVLRPHRRRGVDQEDQVHLLQLRIDHLMHPLRLRQGNDERRQRQRGAEENGDIGDGGGGPGEAAHRRARPECGPGAHG